MSFENRISFTRLLGLPRVWKGHREACDYGHADNRRVVMKKLRSVLFILSSFLSIWLLFILFSPNIPSTTMETPPATAEVTQTTPTPQAPPVVVPRVWEFVTTNDSGYKLVVGANLTVNTNQKLSPPTGSVAITGGETQLRELREQAKKAHQQ